MGTASKEEEATASDKALRHLSQIRFHQRFTLPANAAVGIESPIRVTYADCDYRRGGHASGGGPTVVMLGGMYGGRWMPVGSTDALARKHGVRVIAIDKFGQGGTEYVAMKHRVGAFMYLIPSLLDHLGVKQGVSFISHSAGAIYMLNALTSLRHLLHPDRPSVCLLSPWTHTQHSGSLTALKLVPDAVIGKSNGLFKWLNTTAAPAVSFSAGVVSSVSNLGGSGDKQQEEAPKEPAIDEYPGHDNTTDYAPDEPPGSVMFKEMMRYLFVEESKGGADEALLCLKRGENPSWGACEDYDAAIANILAAETRMALAAPGPDAADAQRTTGDGAGGESPKRKLCVKVLFAESDALIGDQGREYFDGLWKKHCATSPDAIEYDSETVAGADHDSITDLKFGVVDRYLVDVRRRWIS